MEEHQLLRRLKHVGLDKLPCDEPVVVAGRLTQWDLSASQLFLDIVKSTGLKAISLQELDHVVSHSPGSVELQFETEKVVLVSIVGVVKSMLKGQQWTLGVWVEESLAGAPTESFQFVEEVKACFGMRLVQTLDGPLPHGDDVVELVPPWFLLGRGAR